MAEKTITLLRTGLFLFVLACSPITVLAQANYEIQVYGADTVPANTLMVELHSNYTLKGR